MIIHVDFVNKKKIKSSNNEEKKKKIKNTKSKNSHEISKKDEFFDDDIENITMNAIASLLMSLEEDGIDSNHPLIDSVLPEIYSIIYDTLVRINK